MFTKATPGLRKCLAIAHIRERVKVKVPLGSCSEFKEVANEQEDKKKSTRNSADLGNRVCNVTEFEL